MLGLVVRLLYVRVVRHLIRRISITAIMMVIFGCDWIIRRQFLEVELLAIGKRLIPLLLELALKIVPFDARLIALLAYVVNMLETLLSHQFLL